MKLPKKLLCAVALASLLVGCDSPSRTVETASEQISAFQAAPDAEKKIAIENSLAKLDAQIEELSKKGDNVQADLFRRQAQSLRSDFQVAKMSQAIDSAKNAIEGIGQAFKEAGKTIGETFKADSTNEP